MAVYDFSSKSEPDLPENQAHRPNITKPVSYNTKKASLPAGSIRIPDKKEEAKEEQEEQQENIIKKSTDNGPRPLLDIEEIEL